MMLLPLTVHTNLQPSSTLHSHIERRLAHAIRPFAGLVDRAEVWISDENGRKHGPADKLVRVVVRMSHGGRIVAAAASDDFYASVVRAAARVRQMLARRVSSRRRHATPRGEA
jgi:ribosome-associated translation inhibitor RaiA